MRGKILAVLALGLTLTAGSAAAQQSDLLPRTELRNNLRRLRADLQDRLDSRAFGARMRAQALESARATRAGALAAARAERESARAMARINRERIRPMLSRPMRMPPMRIRAYRRRDI